MTEELKNTRDRKLRRKLLWIARMAMPLSPSGDISGELLVSQVSELMRGAGGFEDDSHAVRLLCELSTCGLLIERDGRRRKSESRTLENRYYRLSPDGLMLMADGSPPHPLVDDDRIE